MGKEEGGNLPFDVNSRAGPVDRTNRVTGGRLVLDGDAGHLDAPLRQAEVQASLLGGHSSAFFDALVSPPLCSAGGSTVARGGGHLHGPPLSICPSRGVSSMLGKRRRKTGLWCGRNGRPRSCALSGGDG
jgi:hypothetical protein